MNRMQRGGPRGGQNWQQKRQNPIPLMSTGPLMTDHLGLQDIDKELELLKRKREIIEQQQQILSHEFRRNEPQFNQGSRFDDYAQLYDDMRSYDHPSRKRPIPVWEDEIPTKRFTGPSQRPRVRPSPRGPSSYQGSQPRHTYQPPIKSSRPSPKNYTSRITKAPPAINKLDSYPVAERKKLISEANGLADKAKLKPVYVKEQILTADIEPSKQMTGRLELALGSIIKEMKLNPQHASAISSLSVLRLVKKTVRERIREIMMGQAVGSGESIRARYREVYNEQSDNEIVEKAKAEAAQVDNNHKKIVTPEEYFKTNMNKIIYNRLKEMMDKLEEISTGKPVANETEVENSAAAETTEEEKQNEEALAEITNSERFKAIDRMVSNRITSGIKKLIPTIIKILNIDEKYNKLADNITAQTLKKLNQKPGNVSKSSSNEAADESTLSLSESTSEPKGSFKPFPYYAKLMGKPSLPKRPLMREFFENYGPRSIKKHRSMHNLLFVGFNDKEAFEKLLAADGTRIGKYLLSIRVSERKDVKPDLDTSSEDKIIGSELDEQLTDLLTSIRNEDEGAEEENAVENPEENEGNAPYEPEVINDDENVDDNNDQGDDTANIIEDNDNTNNIEGDNTNNIEDDNTNNIEDDNTNNIEDDNTNNIEEYNTNNIEDEANGNEENDENTSNAETPQADAVEIAGANTEDNEPNKQEAEKIDVLPEIAKPIATPVRASARIAATPGRVQTRRASRLVQNE